MKRTNFFKSAGSLFVAGMLAATFVACDSSSDRSTVDGAEEVVETETEINEPAVGFEDGEYNTTTTDYDLDREYTYEDRELVKNRIQEDIDRADRSLESIDTKLETEAETIDEEARREWEESKQELAQERDRLNQRLQEVENSTEADWERVRNDVNTTLRDWEKEWEELRAKDIDVDVDVQEEPTTIDQ